MSRGKAHIQVYDAVYEAMLNNVKDGIWKPKERIPGEIELANTYEVSRNSVRTAIKILCSNNILVCRPGIGTYVTENAQKEILNQNLLNMMQDADNSLEINEVREILDAEIAYRAASKCTEEDVELLESCINNEREAAKKDDTDGYIYWGSLFHEHIAEMTGNKILVTIYKSLKYQFDQDRKWYIKNKKPSEVYNENDSSDRCILEALKEHNAEKAKMLMQEHAHIRRHGINEITGSTKLGGEL